MEAVEEIISNAQIPGADAAFEAARINNSWARLAIGSGITALALRYMAPASVYSAPGVPRPFRPTNPGDPEATWAHWLLISGLVGVAVSGF